MCGIAGLFSKNIICSTQNKQLNQIHNELKMRGPDSSGSWQNKSKNVILKHTRLSIQDMTSNGNQPMIYKHLAITYNGEIYNYKKLRKELQSKGYVFDSNCDTEVVLKSYDCYGEDCVNHFDGQFAFAIWNDKTHELFIARDPFGKKPLYYSLINNNFWFSSFLPALVRHSPISKSINPISVYFYFSTGVIPAPYTPFENFNKLPAGYMATIKFSEDTSNILITKKQYYNLEFKNKKLIIPENNLIELIKKTFINSVDKRINSDANTGIWLSGGLDSSLIASVAKKELDKNIPTFSIGFEDVDNNKGDEFSYSDYVVERYNLDHHKIFIKTKELYHHLQDCYTNINEPMWEYDMIGHYLLSKYAPKDIKVALSGVGADEIWLGYHWHKHIKDYDLPGDKLFSALLRDKKTISEYINIDYIKSEEVNTIISNQFQYLKESEGTEFEKFLIIEISYFLVDDCLKRTDNTGMRHGVEIRAPFLDHYLVDLSTNIDTSLKYNNDVGKYIIKKMAKSYFPDRFIYRKKGYFPVAPVQYMSDEVKSFCRSILLKPECRNRSIYKINVIKKLLDKQKLSNKEIYILWTVTCFECWLQQFD